MKIRILFIYYCPVIATNNGCFLSRTTSSVDSERYFSNFEGLKNSLIFGQRQLAFYLNNNLYNFQLTMRPFKKNLYLSLPWLSGQPLSDCISAVNYLISNLFCLSELIVEIKNRPVLTQALNYTTVSGCIYVSFLNESLHDFLYINYNGTLIKINEDSHLEDNNQRVHYFPTLGFNRRILSGIFSCVIMSQRVKEESNTTRLYENPGKI